MMSTTAPHTKIVTPLPPSRECSLCNAPEGALVRRHRAKPERWIDGPRYIQQMQDLKAQAGSDGKDRRDWAKEWSPFLGVIELAPSVVDGLELLLCEQCRQR